MEPEASAPGCEEEGTREAAEGGRRGEVGGGAGRGLGGPGGGDEEGMAGLRLVPGRGSGWRRLVTWMEQAGRVTCRGPGGGRLGRILGEGARVEEAGRITEEGAGMEAAARVTVEASRGIWRKGRPLLRPIFQSPAPQWSLPPSSPPPWRSPCRWLPASSAWCSLSVPALTVPELVYLGLPHSLMFPE